ncbi:hypothetical protein TWF481_002843 [Arthrobotrys musiformis]|uniref:Uncharacterized protein n=1 Tax=Arthrobotrys musiformis TaxID=47236 RepID=A0AAV9VSM3_9PEZI
MSTLKSIKRISGDDDFEPVIEDREATPRPNSRRWQENFDQADFQHDDYVPPADVPTNPLKACRRRVYRSSKSKTASTTTGEWDMEHASESTVVGHPFSWAFQFEFKIKNVVKV